MQATLPDPSRPDIPARLLKIIRGTQGEGFASPSFGASRRHVGAIVTAARAASPGSVSFMPQLRTKRHAAATGQRIALPAARLECANLHRYFNGLVHLRTIPKRTVIS
ncbi:hypothetical protein [Blastomonas sp. SL216]|uniref:hypothetical protein n=1 Tax=Blastomonas sp. SL216 TaxID=2995169 RepID=UPI0023777939|nr:hypothetical protein OU999_14360 [Blastomonas sp. SL216]